MGKTLVLYTFYKYKSSVEYFIKNGIFKHDNVDFMIIANHKDIALDVPDYVKVMRRENIGFDFGAWSEGLLTDDYYKNYDHFVFVNCSVKGPFLDRNFKGKWIDLFLNGLKDNVKLFGVTINTRTFDHNSDPRNKAHVQSYAFAINKNTLEYLISCEIFSLTNYAKNYMDAIVNKEIRMSRKIIENKWNIGDLIGHYKGVDFTFSDKKPSDYGISYNGDMTHDSYTHGAVFVKWNR